MNKNKKNNTQQNQQQYISTQTDDKSSDNSDSDNEEYLRATKMSYDPNSSARIICIELENNQHIYINYKEGWTIRDLILSIIKRHEYHLLNTKRQNILSFSNHPQLFDLSLCFYDTTKSPHENRMDENITIDKLHEMRLLKNYRTPFFILKSNYTPLSYIYSEDFNIEQLKEIKNSKFNQYAMYLNYLPRISKNLPNILLAHPEIEDYFHRNKKGYNEFFQFKTSKLSADIENIDWFIYDKESVNFLMEMEEKEFVQTNSIRYINGKVYFEDMLDDKNNNSSESQPRSSSTNKLTDKELDKIQVNLILVNNVDNPKDESNKSFKTKISSKTTAFDLISKCLVNDPNNTDPTKKILKVRSLNDYVFNLTKPLINFSYINECVKLNKTIEFLVIDNPDVNHNLSDVNRSSMKSRKKITGGAETSNVVDLNTSIEERTIANKFDLSNIANYNPDLNKVNNDICKIIDSLEKGVNKGKGNKNKGKQTLNRNNTNQSGKFTLDDLINSFNQDVEKEIDNGIKNDIPKKDLINKNEEEKNNYLINERKKKFSFLQLNCNNSKYLQKRAKYKGLPMNQEMPNVFASKNIKQKNINLPRATKKFSISTNFDKSKVIQNIYVKPRNPLINKKEINLYEINRPFSILIKNADIYPLLNSTDYDTKNITTVLLFKFELFCSNSSICPPKQIRWKTNTKDQKPVFNKRLYFDINYSQLPNVCSVLIKVKFLKYDKNNQATGGDTKFWANYRLFDQNNRLKVGLHKVNLLEGEICDDIYYLYNDNPKEEISSKIYFEIESFSCPVINELQTQIKKLKKKKKKKK